MSDPPTSDERIGLDLPADARHAATARVLVASLAADAGFSVDEIDDLRLALNEAVALLVDDGDGEQLGDVTMIGTEAGDRVEIELRITPGTMTIEIRRREAVAVPEIDELADRILAAVVDSHVLGPGLVRLHKAAIPTGAPGTRPTR